MSEVIGERLLTILVCTCDFFDVINDHKLGLFSQEASKVYYVGCSLWMYVFLIVKHVYISDIEVSQHSGKLVSILLDKITGP